MNYSVSHERKEKRGSVQNHPRLVLHLALIPTPDAYRIHRYLRVELNLLAIEFRLSYKFLNILLPRLLVFIHKIFELKNALITTAINIVERFDLKVHVPIQPYRRVILTRRYAVGRISQLLESSYQSYANSRNVRSSIR